MRQQQKSLQLLLVAWLSFMGCSDSAGGPRLARLSVSASSGGAPVLESECVRVPVLWGSRVTRQLDVGGEFTLRADATRAGVTVSMEGVVDPASHQRSVSTDSLRNGYAEEIDVVTLTGGVVTVNMSSVCE